MINASRVIILLDKIHRHRLWIERNRQMGVAKAHETVIAGQIQEWIGELNKAGIEVDTVRVKKTLKEGRGG